MHLRFRIGAGTTRCRVVNEAVRAQPLLSKSGCAPPQPAHKGSLVKPVRHNVNCPYRCRFLEPPTRAGWSLWPPAPPAVRLSFVNRPSNTFVGTVPSDGRATFAFDRCTVRCGVRRVLRSSTVDRVTCGYLDNEKLDYSLCCTSILSPVMGSIGEWAQ
jgi:hypothetical protein